MLCVREPYTALGVVACQGGLWDIPFCKLTCLPCKGADMWSREATAQLGILPFGPDLRQRF